MYKLYIDDQRVILMRILKRRRLAVKKNLKSYN